jgi:hypothetical protein
MQRRTQNTQDLTPPSSLFLFRANKVVQLKGALAKLAAFEENRPAKIYWFLICRLKTHTPDLLKPACTCAVHACACERVCCSHALDPYNCS